MQRALLAWCHVNVPDNVRTARHCINWFGEQALAACVTEADFMAVTVCFEISMQFILENQQ